MGTMSDELIINEKGSGESIVFIHGLGSTSKIWDNQVSILSNDYKTIIVDIYGHGENRNLPKNVSIRKTAEKVLDLLKDKNINNFNLVGHSLGGLICIEIVKQYENKVSKLILVDTPTKQTGLASLSIVQYLNLKLIESNYETVIKEHYKKMTDNSELQAKLIKDALETDKFAYYSYFKELFKVDYSNIIGNLNVNTYVFFTKTLISDKSKINKIKDKYGYENVSENRIYYYKEAGHFLMLEEAEKFTNRLITILSS